MTTVFHFTFVMSLDMAAHAPTLAIIPSTALPPSGRLASPASNSITEAPTGIVQTHPSSLEVSALDRYSLLLSKSSCLLYAPCSATPQPQTRRVRIMPEARCHSMTAAASRCRQT